ncbi:outer membrane protein [Polynucleobacter sp. AP-Kolm-20A-A1]|uniref:outer membrane protein n=1 Tax=Polynucleobacter sp. AP-Kolm-20A-A1 TaxID=2081041 RepID=UPI001BFDA300|nr:outer membrane beta-barrel protein [Polynucleobacter sp. AP-Kolm-20A-A1]QWE20908.1 porin family protein [Polynucleobacter sp. AP-Kolm-20A-A1]
MKKLLAASLLSVAATGAFAQANAFEGFSAGVKVSSVGGSTALSSPGFSGNWGQQSVVPTIEAGYTYGVSKEIALGLTATYDLANTKLGSEDNANIKGKNHYSLNFKPGYVFNNTTMLYAILGYNSMTGSLNVNGASASTTFNGFGAGVGLQTLLSKNIYVQVEAQQLTYSGVTKSIGGENVTFTPSATVGTLGLGYKF